RHRLFWPEMTWGMPAVGPECRDKIISYLYIVQSADLRLATSTNMRSSSDTAASTARYYGLPATLIGPPLDTERQAALLRAIPFVVTALSERCRSFRRSIWRAIVLVR